MSSWRAPGGTPIQYSRLNPLDSTFSPSFPGKTPHASAHIKKPLSLRRQTAITKENCMSADIIVVIVLAVLFFGGVLLIVLKNRQANGGEDQSSSTPANPIEGERVSSVLPKDGRKLKK
jgi:hypothetical protein